MAPLQSHAEAQSVTCLNTLDKESATANHHHHHHHTAQQLQLEEDKRQYYRSTSTSGSATSATTTATPTATPSDYYSSVNLSSPTDNRYQSFSAQRSNQKGDIRILKPSSSNTLVPVASLVSLHSISPSRKSVVSSSSNSSNTAKHEQSAAAAATAAAASTPPEKEKKRKEVSSSRVKKFHRHFAQVSKDEKLINYFSCALVSDILLQGHLYITDQHFAFYSNVFGYVTKVVIPTSSVTKISKEKTAKIIPNAVGVATADERHVFGSFISREAAFRLMCSVCPPLAPAEIIAKLPVDIVDISEEYSIEDDSSCSISGNESPPQGSVLAIQTSGDPAEQMLSRRNVIIAKSTSNEKQRHSDIPSNAKNANSAFAHHPNAGMRASAPPSSRHNNSSSTSPSKVLPALNHSVNAAQLCTPTTGAAVSAVSNLTMIIAGTASSTTSASSTPTPSTSSSPTTVIATPKSAVQAAADSFKALSKNALLRVKFPTELHVVYLGVLLTMVLALFSVFLLYRILDIEAKTSSYRSSVDFNWRSGNDEDIFVEALRWQKELQSKSTEEAQNILTTNLEQIAKVRRSLETLSMLIHDRSSAYANRDDSD